MKPKSHRHLAHDQRSQITAYLSMNLSQSAIAKKLGVHRSTITRELHRNGKEHGYDHTHAQECASARRSQASSKKTKLTNDIKAHIITMLKDTHASPEQISGRLWLQLRIKISHQTIYSFIRRDRLAGGALYLYLRRKGRKMNYSKGKVAGRGVIPNRIDISNRPLLVESKKRFGDFEVDTIVGAKHKGVIVSIVDRASKLALLMLTSAGTAALVSDAVIARLLALKKQQLPLHTITADNGKEFAKHAYIAECTGASFFFARPYKSCDRGLNEHTNGQVRHFLPKGTDFTKLTNEDVAKIEWMLNNRPRKSLNYRTPIEVVNSVLLSQAGVVAFQT